MGVKKFRYGSHGKKPWGIRAAGHGRHPKERSQGTASSVIDPMPLPTFPRRDDMPSGACKTGLAYPQPGWARGPWPKRGAALAKDGFEKPRSHAFAQVNVGMTCFPKPTILGTPTSHRVGRVGHDRHPSCARKGQTKGLSLTERRLSFAFAEGTPRPEGQALRLTARGD